MTAIKKPIHFLKYPVATTRIPPPAREGGRNRMIRPHGAVDTSYGFPFGGLVDSDIMGTSTAPVDPLLDSLAFNGGQTKTAALQVGSPAIDRAGGSEAQQTDQRGAKRDATPDIGAFEFGAVPPADQLYTPPISSPFFPDVLKVWQNYPNPFNGMTTIDYAVLRNDRVLVRILTAHGKQIRTIVDAWHQAGPYSIQWTPDGLPSGIYLCQVQTCDASTTKKLAFLK
jgi:hypothetical protein